MSQNVDQLRIKWRQLQTARQDIRARLLAQAEAEVATMRTDFNALLWKAVKVDREKIQRISDLAGISRAQIHKTLKEYSHLANSGGAGASGRYKIGYNFGNSHMIEPLDPQSKWKQPVVIYPNGGWSWGLPQGDGDAFQAEYNNSETGLADLVEKYIEDNAATPRAEDSRDSLDDEEDD